MVAFGCWYGHVGSNDGKSGGSYAMRENNKRGKITEIRGFPFPATIFVTLPDLFECLNLINVSCVLVGSRDRHL